MSALQKLIDDLNAKLNALTNDQACLEVGSDDAKRTNGQIRGLIYALDAAMVLLNSSEERGRSKSYCKLEILKVIAAHGDLCTISYIERGLHGRGVQFPKQSLIECLDYLWNAKMLSKQKRGPRGLVVFGMTQKGQRVLEALGGNND